MRWRPVPTPPPGPAWGSCGLTSPVPWRCHLCSSSWAAWGGLNQRLIWFLCWKQNQHLRMFKFSFHRDYLKGKILVWLMAEVSWGCRSRPGGSPLARTMVPGWQPGEVEVCFSRWVTWQLRQAVLPLGAEERAVDCPSAPLPAVPCPRAGGIEVGVERRTRRACLQMETRGAAWMGQHRHCESLASCPHPETGGQGELRDFPKAFGVRSQGVLTSTRTHGKLSTWALSKTSFASAWERECYALRGKSFKKILNAVGQWDLHHAVVHRAAQQGPSCMQQPPLLPGPDMCRGMSQTAVPLNRTAKQ